MFPNKIWGSVFLLSFFAGILFAQQTAETAETAPNVRTTVIHLEQSESVVRRESLPDVQIIFGNLAGGQQVRFRHDGAIMYCDSAHVRSRDNTFNAFGNVQIIEGDSIFIYGDYLFYDGNTRIAHLRRNVRMLHNNSILTTDSLNYDRVRDLAYYWTGGKLQDGENTLTSVWGQYSPNTNQAVFRNNVRMVNETMRMYSDTLLYNTETQIADIVGFTHIIHNDETNIFSTKGWHNTETEQSMLLNRSLIVHTDGRTVIGDTLFYDRQNHFVEGFSNVEMNDTIQQTTLLGHYVFYDELHEFGFATDSALFIDWSDEDRLYLHADTLHVSKDSIYDVLRAFHNVRFFRADIQGAADSLVYLSRDSVAIMFGQPVVWSGENQLSGEIIRAYIANETLERIHVPRGAFVIQKVDNDGHFNQISGTELTAFIYDDELRRVEVSGSAETIYYPIDDSDSTIIGINKTQSSHVNMFFVEQQIERIVLTVISTGTMYPLDELSGEELFLSGFFWIEEQQPRKPEDVFLRFPRNRHSSSIIRVRSAAAPQETTDDGEQIPIRNVRPQPSR